MQDSLGLLTFYFGFAFWFFHFVFLFPSIIFSSSFYSHANTTDFARREGFFSELLICFPSISTIYFIVQGLLLNLLDHFCSEVFHHVGGLLKDLGVLFFCRFFNFGQLSLNVFIFRIQDFLNPVFIIVFLYLALFSDLLVRLRVIAVKRSFFILTFHVLLFNLLWDDLFDFFLFGFRTNKIKKLIGNSQILSIMTKITNLTDLLLVLKPKRSSHKRLNRRT